MYDLNEKLLEYYQQNIDDLKERCENLSESKLHEYAIENTVDEMSVLLKCNLEEVYGEQARGAVD